MPTSRTLTPFGPTPSLRQLAWHKMEFYGFVHFTTNTFTGREWGYGDESPTIFNPSHCDPRQWADVAKRAGMTGMILTCKHHDGFCLWPTKTTPHSIKASPWKNGQGDLVREFTDACREAGLKVGLYISPWDRNHARYGHREYIDVYREQLRELLTNYGELFEVWFDGANGGDGYYGGANETRRIDQSTYYDWPNTWAIVRELQPNAVMFSDAGPDIRWIGNERGQAAETTWYTLNTAGRYPGYNPPGYDCVTDLGVGHELGSDWVAPEADVSIRPGWFYHAHEDSRVRTPSNLLKLYYESVGRGTTFLLSFPPDQRGLIHEIDVANVMKFREAVDTIFKTNLAADATVVAEATLADAFAPANVLSDADDTVWTPADGTAKKSSWIELRFNAANRLNHIVLREAIQFGQRIRRWHIEADINGAARTIVTGTTIGAKRIARFDDITTSRLRLVIDDAHAAPILTQIAAYCAPPIVTDPTITRDAATGKITINVGTGIRARYTIDGTEPTTSSPIVTDAIDLPTGGTVRAAVFAEENPTALVLASANAISATFGLPKSDWRVVDCSSAQPGYEPHRAIDDSGKTFWHTPWDATGPSHPHTLTIDLGKTVTIQSIGILPRHDGLIGGIVDRYAIYLSQTLTFGSPASMGRFDNIAANPIEQIVTLATPTATRYIRFVSLSSVNNDKAASLAELNVYI